MANLFSKINRLKNQGWTWDRFLFEIEQQLPAGLEEKTLKAHFRQPHRKSTRHVEQVIQTLHNNAFPSPFPSDVEGMMRVYSNLFKCKKHVSKDQDIIDLSLFIKEVIEQSSHELLLRRARLHWLYANMHFDQLPSLRAGHHKHQLHATQQTAIEHYNYSLTLMDEHIKTDNKPYLSEFTLYKARQNVLACYLNVVQPEKRFNDENVLNYLKQSDFIPRSMTVMVNEPYQWVVARNGLRFSSITKHKANCIWFFESLVKSSKFFSDLNYTPLGYPAIADSPEFNWAIDHALQGNQ